MDKIVFKIFVLLLVLTSAVIYFSLNRVNINPDPTAPETDPKTYLYLGEQLLNNHIYAEKFPKDDPFRAWRPPFYSVLIAVSLWVSQNNLQFVIFLQYLLLLGTGALVCYLHYLIFHSFYGGIISCIMILFYAPFYYYASYLYSEILYIFILTVFFVAIYKAIDTKNGYLYGIAGFSFGVSILIRTLGLPLLIFSTVVFIITAGFIGYRFVRRHNVGINKQTILNMLVFFATAWMVIIPITIRNYLVLDKFVLVNTANGMNFYFGAIPDFYRKNDKWHTENWRLSGDRWVEEHQKTVNPLRSQLGEVGSQQALFNLAFSQITEHPDEYIQLKLQTLYRYIIPNLNYKKKLGGLFSQSSSFTILVYFLFFIGVLNVFITQNIKGFWIVLSFFVLAISASLAFFSERFVVVTTPLYFIIVSSGLIGILNWIRRVYSNSRFIIQIYNRTIRANITTVALVMSIILMGYFGVWQKILDSGRYNIAHILLNRTLYTSALPQNQREILLGYAVRFLPQDDIPLPINTDVSQEEGLLLADIARKKGVFNRSLWEYAFNQPSSGNWSSFEMPPNLDIQDGMLYIPFDNRWKIRSTFHWKNDKWQVFPDIRPELLRDNTLKAIAENTKGVHELFIVSWYGPIGRGPYHTLDFEVQALPDTLFSVVVYLENGDTFELPIEMIPDNDGWAYVQIPLSEEKISFVDFYVSDKNLENEPVFGISIRNGRFSF